MQEEKVWIADSMEPGSAPKAQGPKEFSRVCHKLKWKGLNSSEQTLHW